MKIKILSSSIGHGPSHQFLTSFLINETIAIDAGAIGMLTPLSAQKNISHVFLSHSHIDHIASLPAFLDNTYVPGTKCVTIWSHEQVLDSLRTDVFNDRLWPDLIRLSEDESPFLRMQLLHENQPIIIDGLSIEAFFLDHVVPTYGFLVSDRESTVAIVSDTGPCDSIARIAAAGENLHGVFLEASFPNHMHWLAEKSKHLTPATFADEAKRFPVSARLIAVHLKAEFSEQIQHELGELGMANVEIGRFHYDYEF